MAYCALTLRRMASEKSAIKFLKQALKTSGVMSIQITTDKEPALYPALKEYLRIR